VISIAKILAEIAGRQDQKDKIVADFLTPTITKQEGWDSKYALEIVEL